MDAIQILTNLIETNGLITIFTSVVTVFSVFSAVTPTPKEGTTLAKFYSLVNLLALNIGKAKDKG